MIIFIIINNNRKTTKKVKEKFIVLRKDQLIYYKMFKNISNLHLMLYLTILSNITNDRINRIILIEILINC